MTFKEFKKMWDKNAEFSFSEYMNIVNAVSQVFPMIVLANLTKNTYTMIRDEGFLCNEIAVSGCYDDLIDDNMSNIHANYQKYFYECFSREHLIRSFEEGKTEVYAEIYQKNNHGQYHWVSTHVIRIESESGDIMHVCLNRVLGENTENRNIKRR